MKKIFKFFSFLLIFSIVTLSTIPFTNDISTAQAASGIYLNETSLTLEADHYKTLRVQGTTSKISWYTSNDHVASVSGSGKIFAKAPGNATITANVGGKRLRCNVNVIYMSKNVVLTPDKTFPLTVYGAKGKVIWSSNDELIATVSDSGKVTAIAQGTTTITAFVDDKELISNITVVAINHKKVVLELGGWSGFIKTLKVNNASGKISWSSSNKSVATISNDGKVRAQGAGSATITATVDGTKLTSSIKVLKASTKAFTLKMGKQQTLKIYGTTSKVTWDSNKKTVATVSSDGTVTSVSEGVASIYGFVDGRKVTITVTVVK